MTTVELPLWLVVLMTLVCAYAVIGSVLLPSTRWYLRSRLLRSIERVNLGLQIKIRPFQRTKCQVLIDRLAWDRQVLDAIEAEASDAGVPPDVLQSRVHAYASEIVPAFNVFIYFRIGYWLARWFSRFVYRVHVAAIDFEKLQQVDPEASVVFVMNHRSNMDYLLVTYLAARQVSISYAVGEWANFFPLRPLIKALGGFFVRRRSNDALYHKVLERYVHMATREGVCQAVYLEGGLTRDGSLGEPRLGFLDYMLRDYDASTDRDIVFVPVAVNYDHVLEDDRMLGWDDGGERPVVLLTLRRAIRLLRVNSLGKNRERLEAYGHAGVNFGEPVSAKAWLVANGVPFKSLEKEARFVQVRALADDLMDAVAHVMPILPVPLISYVFEKAEREQLASSDIVKRVSELIDGIVASGGAMKSEERPKLGTLANALRIMVNRGILDRQDGSYALVDHPLRRKLCRYYANSIARIVSE